MKRELVVTPNHDGRARTVTVEGRLPDGRLRISIDGQPRDVDAREIRSGTWSILFDGRSFVVDLDRQASGDADSVAASVGGAEVRLVVEDAKERKLAASSSVARSAPSRGELVRAPIAGKVVKLLVAVGDVVAANSPVIAIEAMKMENELVSERGGTVAAIHKQVGQAVESGELLVELA